ncbi:hypothetical protein [Cochlodiniinecator piscidefendens]|uniref:hypothetical protein n=1 Tax=Cochlodiniinecator piscidefendens TaxID=2715756 RepID=UPI001409C14F|nr:hypothetical protein [Cochlodiniinecator piscidefendens]
MPEVVDGGQQSAGGITPHLIAVGQRVQIAQQGLATLPDLRHRARSSDECGAHQPISYRVLIDSVCVFGVDLAELALRKGWFVKRDGKHTIPKQQSQKLKAALVEGLEAVRISWKDANIDVSKMVEGVEVG